MAMKVCSECSGEISDTAKQCPHCGAKQRPKTTRITWAVAILLVALLVIPAINENIPGSNPVEKLSKKEYIEQASGLDYRKAMLNKIPKGTPSVIKGQVNQILGDTNIFVLLSSGVFDYTDDRVWVKFDKKQEFIEEDIVRIYGKYQGTRKYTSVLGDEKEVPYIQGRYAEVIKEKR